jgi:hypothetical protein
MLAVDPHSSAEPISWSKAEFSPTMLVAAILLFFLTLCLGCSSGAKMIGSGSTSTAASSPGSGGSGSGSGSGPSSSGSGSQQTPLVLTPAGATIQTGQTIQFSLTGQATANNCTWSTSSPAILSLVGDEEFQGQQAGSATIAVTCGSQNVQALVSVTPPASSGPLKITGGGTYTGNWSSDDPATPAVTIATDDPVTIQASTITSRGTLISISGVSAGANVTIDNVTGNALDPGVAGAQRGQFVMASRINSLIVRNCTMAGVSFGVNAVSSTVANLQILNNKAVNLEDRASDGQGGLEEIEPNPGHFILLNSIAAPAGAEIAWNQIVQTIGRSSTTDVINLYRSQGSPGQPIWVHDNYIEGDSSPATPANFSGAGIIADGSQTAPVTAYALFENNEVVHTAGTGVAIANGHDITAVGNRIVSCGQDGSGNWFAMPFAVGVYIWDAYGAGPSLFYNNTVTGSAGGLVRPSSNGNPAASDFWGSATSMTYPGNAVVNNDFTDPCLARGQANGRLNLAAETAERAYWTAKVTAAQQQIGDQHNTAQ